MPSASPSKTGWPTSMSSELPSISVAPSSQPSEHQSVSDWPTSMSSSQSNAQPSLNSSLSSMPRRHPSLHPYIIDWPTSQPSSWPTLSAQPSSLQGVSPVSVAHGSQLYARIRSVPLVWLVFLDPKDSWCSGETVCWFISSPFSDSDNKWFIDPSPTIVGNFPCIHMRLQWKIRKKS